MDAAKNLRCRLASKGLFGIAMILFVALGGLLWGYDTGTISGILAMKYWVGRFATQTTTQGEPEITPGQTSVIVSMLSVGTLVGALAGAPLGDFFGRKRGLMVSCVIFSGGAAIQTGATAIPLFTAGRAVAGVGVGILSALIPVYQAETSPYEIRGTLTGAYQLFVTIGLLLASCVNRGTQHRDDTGSYRIPCGIQIGIAIILFAGMALLPETPRYYIMKDNLVEARMSLSRLRRLAQDDSDINTELQKMLLDRQAELHQESGQWKDCFSTQNRNLLRLFTGCVLSGLNQLNGINFIFYFGTQFFQNSGIQNPYNISLIMNLVNAVSTLPGLWLVEKWGRRPTLLLGAGGMFVCEFIVGIVGTAANSTVANSVLIAFVCLYIVFFASTWGPIGWTIVGEIFPLRLRAKSAAMSIACVWIFNWAIAFVTPYMVGDGPGSAHLSYKVFFVWGSSCFISFVFVFFFIFETRGLTLEKINVLYNTCKRAWRSNRRRLEILSSIDEVAAVEIQGKSHAEHFGDNGSLEG